MITKEELGKRIKKARKEKSLKIGKQYTGQMLADDIGISRSYLGDIESGRIFPNIELLKKIAAALEIDISELLGGPSEPFIIRENAAEYGADELEIEFERLKPKLKKLSKEERDKLLKIINAYLDK